MAYLNPGAGAARRSIRAPRARRGHQRGADADDRRHADGRHLQAEVQELDHRADQLERHQQHAAATTWTALEALTNIGAGNITTAVGTMTAGVGTLTLTFAGALAKLNTSRMIAVADNSLTGTSPDRGGGDHPPGVTRQSAGRRRARS
jgi:formyltetrahydrofolate synthetase